MAKLNFPDPTTTTVYEEAGLKWTWNDTLKVWSSEAQAGSDTGGGASVSVGENPPGSPEQGDMWWANTDEDDGGGRLYIYKAGAWVDTSLPGSGGGDFLSSTEDDTAAGKITLQGGAQLPDIKDASGLATDAEGNIIAGLGGDGEEPLWKEDSGKLYPKTLGNKVGIGTSTAIFNLDVVGNQAIRRNSGSDQRLEFFCEGTGNYITSQSPSNSEKDLIISNGRNTKSIIFNTGNSNKLILSANGNLKLSDGDFNVAAGGISSNLAVKVGGTAVEIGHRGDISLNRPGGNTEAAPITIRRSNSGTTNSWIGIEFFKKSESSRCGLIRLDGSTTRTIDTRLGATGVAMADGAVDIVKALQPKVITQGGETFTSFLPADLAGTFAEAVDGEAGATVAIGTYTNAEGVVETDVEEPESIPYGETWEQTGVKDLMQGVSRGELIPLLTKALQEALSEIDNLKERLAALEGA